MSLKGITTSYIARQTQAEPRAPKPELYRLAVALRADNTAIVEVATSYQQPFALATIYSQYLAHVWIAEVRGNTVVVKAQLAEPHSPPCTGTVYLHVVDGTESRISVP